ncbi:MAG TPA: hypothetical protein VE973_03990, partial [Candidatus Limnocylindria bacterium]|nr:hypothetical protein [Candidatus Limnocylindria bacterium]
LKVILPSADTYFPKSGASFYKGKGCKACNNTGFKGRVGIFELMTVTKDLQDLIVKAPSSKQVWELARKQGLKTLFEDGIEKVKQGVSTLEELMRVAPPST